MSNNGKLLTIEEVACKLGVSAKTVRRYVREGRLLSMKATSPRGPYQIRIPEQSLRNYLGQGDQEPGQTPEKDVQDVHVDQVVQDNVQVFLSKNEPLMQATYRIGYLEAQLDMSRKMLTEGEAAREALFKERDLAIQDKAVTEIKLNELAVEKESVLQEKNLLEKKICELEQELLIKTRLEEELSKLSQEKETLAAVVRELQLPWWGKLFGTKTHSKPAPS